MKTNSFILFFAFHTVCKQQNKRDKNIEKGLWELTCQTLKPKNLKNQGVSSPDIDQCNRSKVQRQTPDYDREIQIDKLDNCNIQGNNI